MLMDVISYLFYYSTTVKIEMNDIHLILPVITPVFYINLYNSVMYQVNFSKNSKALLI